MDWIRTDLSKALPKPENAPAVHHRGETIFLGSCFSENIAAKMKQAAFPVSSNPFGIIFHPIPLAKCITDTINGTEKEELLQNGDVHLSFDASSMVYALSEQSLLEKLNLLRKDFLEKLRAAETVIITLGTAHGYRRIANEKIAANCHKVNGAEFKKELTSLTELFDCWQEALTLLKNINPSVNIIFTISPVRYSRDGWVENNRSKARLLELASQLESELKVHYFPAYEIVNDLLRDYRFFEKDGAHPNSLAIDEVWEVFSNWYFSDTTKELVRSVLRLRQMEQHRELFPESGTAQVFRNKLQNEKQDLLERFPFLSW